MNRILIVEDETHLAEGLRFNLEAEGYGVRVVDNGEEALALLPSGEAPFDLVVLDIMLPGIDGFSVVTELRRREQFVPVLILTARGRPEEVLRGFECGADDYLAKPFELAILLARIRGLLRRREWLARAAAPEPAAPPEVYRFADVIIDFTTLEICARGEKHQLTLMEANLLRYLVQHEGRAVSRKAMIEDVWGLREDTDTRPIDNFIVRLRRYIEREPSRPRYLRTVRGVGYRFVAQPED